MKFEVAFTADVVDEESAANGDARERGWIDPRWSMTQVYENREDVTVETFDTREEAEAYIEETIGNYDSFDGETWYAQDPHEDYKTGDTWSYAGHITEVA